MVKTNLVSKVGGGARGIAELNRCARDERGGVRGDFAGEGHGLSEEDESRINDDGGGRGGGGGRATAAAAALIVYGAARSPPRQLPVVQWERFLPVRTLKVLLVENDDSTRQVVGALLRNCSYDVTAAANGLQAWKILKDLTNHIDLVLTEVAMPGLSGIGLLCKIMSHNTCKNIPVIMMSSNDSVRTVFRCLSKGAVDFLVKPIRKNELKNLWQHIWRKCHNSSGSVSGSGIQTQKFAKSMRVNNSDDNTGSNNEENNGSIGLSSRDRSDNGSGTQSSWTKRAAEVDCPQVMSPLLAGSPDSTCAQVIHPKIDFFCHKWLPVSFSRECQELKEVTDDSMGKDLEIGVPGNPYNQRETGLTEKVSNNITIGSLNKLPGSGPEIEGTVRVGSSSAPDKPSIQAVDLIGAMANSIDAQLHSINTEVPYGLSKVLEDKDKAIDALVESASLDLSLKRTRSSEGETTIHDRNILRRSNLSAFSRYQTSVASTRPPAGYGGSCSPLDNSSEAVQTDSTHNMKYNPSAAPLNPGSNGSSDNNDKGSNTNNVFTEAIQSAHTSAFHPVQLHAPIPRVILEKTDAMKGPAIVGKPSCIQHQPQVQHKHHHYHHHHHIHRMPQHQVPPNHNDLSLRAIMEANPHCGPSNVFGGPIEGNAANYSLNRSSSGSNHGSNGQNGVNAAVNVGVNMESIHGIGGSNGNGSGSGVDHNNRYAQREAALSKFRQKRKVRNFKKKVRYHSRKKLAEQRPRVRGQFVRRRGDVTANELGNPNYFGEKLVDGKHIRSR